MKFLKQKRGQALVAGMSALIGFGLAFVVAGLVLVYGANIVEQQRTQIQNSLSSYNVSNPGSWSAAYNVSGNTLQGVNTLSSNQSTIAQVGAGVIIIGFLISAFGGFLLLRNRG